MGKGTDEMSTVEEIEHDIHRTEAEMSETIDEIQRRLSPRHIAAETRETISKASSRTAAAVGDAVRQKPWLPVALVAGVAGAAAVMYFARKKRHAQPAAYPPGTFERGAERASGQKAGQEAQQKSRYGLGAAGIVLGGVIGALIPTTTAEAGVYDVILAKLKDLSDQTPSGESASESNELAQQGQW